MRTSFACRLPSLISTLYPVCVVRVLGCGIPKGAAKPTEEQARSTGTLPCNSRAREGPSLQNLADISEHSSGLAGLIIVANLPISRIFDLILSSSAKMCKKQIRSTL